MANKRFGFILKLIADFKDPLCLKPLYCALVHSILEFVTAVWSTYNSSWVNRFETVQIKCVRHALSSLPWTDSANQPPYRERCKFLGTDAMFRKLCSSPNSWRTRLAPHHYWLFWICLLKNDRSECITFFISGHVIANTMSFIFVFSKFNNVGHLWSVSLCRF